MSIAAVFDVPGMTQAQYEQVIRDLNERGASSPDGRMAHVASAKPGGWWVVDVWESTEHLNRFVPVLMPVLSGAGVTPATPTILPIHTITLP